MKRFLAAVVSAAGMTSALADSIEIRHSGEVPPVTGKPQNFTGHSVISPIFSPNDVTRANVGLVEFSPGARTTWHTHPVGQMLFVTAGMGWIQEEGQDRRVIEPNDVVWIPAGIKHWHGATDTTSMSHIAMTYVLDGKNVDWLESVSDEQYHRVKQ